MLVNNNSPLEDPYPKIANTDKAFTPVVLLLFDGWGVAPLNEANVFTTAKMPVLSNLFTEYPAALLRTGVKNWNSRYLTLGAGRIVSSSEEKVPLNLTMILAAAGKQQIKIMDTERLAALTYFFNGQTEGRQSGEDWRVISARTGGGLQPLNAVKRVAAAISETLKGVKQYDFIVAALPYIDLTAASGEVSQIKKAAETIDGLLVDILAALPDSGVLLISSAGGNAEKNLDLVSGKIDNGLTDNPVPFLLINHDFIGRTIGTIGPTSEDLSLLTPFGSLADIAPTILHLLNLTPPETMSGKTLWL